MATLPDHLRPKKVANIAGSYQETERLEDPIYAAAEHQQQFSALKNNNIRKIEQVREDQANNAEFLNQLFQQELGNDAINDEQYAARLARDERYQEVKDNLMNEDELKQVLEKDFKLPKFDENEDPKAIKDQLLDLQEQEDQIAKKQREEAQQRRQEIRDKYEKMIERTSA